MATMTATTTRPYARSWIDWLFDALSGLPGPTWLAYVGLLVPSLALTHGARWFSGLLAWGELDGFQTLWGVLTVGILAAAHHLRNVAGSAFDAFRPALGSRFPDPERVRYELTVMPPRAILAVTVFGFVITPVYYVADPVASQVIGLSVIGLVLRGLSESFTSVIVIALLMQTIRQGRRVMTLHDAAEHVDPFRPTPLHAFSRLTAQAGIILILFNAAGFVAVPDSLGSEALLTLYVPWLVGFGASSVAVFVLPLLGMHRRLAAEKARIAEAAEERLKGVLAALDHDADAVDTSRADGLGKLLIAVLQEREIVGRLPTWPWSTGTVRGFASALLLPLALFFIQRGLIAILPA